MRIKLNILLLITVVLMSGCASLTSIHRDTPIQEDTVIAVDAKQRFAAVIYKNSSIDKFCAEPSPDALSAISASLSGGITNPGAAQIQAAAALTETSSNIGLRTQSIQLLRDGMYRVCEAYFSGALEPKHVKRLLSRYQDTMVAILAIEQLTGAVTPRQVVLGGNASARLGGDVNKVLDALNAARDKKALLQKKEGELKAKTNPAATQAELDAAKTNIEDVEKVIKEQELALDAAKSLLRAETSGSGQAYEVTTAVNISEKSAMHISKAVTDIVEKAMLTNEFVAACIDIIETNNKTTIMRAEAASLKGESSLMNIIPNMKASKGDGFELTSKNVNALSKFQTERLGELAKVQADYKNSVDNCNLLIQAYASKLQACAPNCPDK